MKKRDTIYNRVINNPDDLALREIFKTVKNDLNRRIRAAKQSYYNKEMEKAGNDTKKLFTAINKLINNNTNKKEEQTIEKLTLNGTRIEDEIGILNSVNHHFVTIGSKLQSKLGRINSPSQNLRNNNSIFLHPTDTSEIRNIIRNLKNSNSSGPDEITTKHLKLITDIIAPTLVRLINEMLETGIFPESCKEAITIPFVLSKLK